MKQYIFIFSLALLGITSIPAWNVLAQSVDDSSAAAINERKMQLRALQQVRNNMRRILMEAETCLNIGQFYDINNTGKTVADYCHSEEDPNVHDHARMGVPQCPPNQKLQWIPFSVGVDGGWECIDDVTLAPDYETKYNNMLSSALREMAMNATYNAPIITETEEYKDGDTVQKDGRLLSDGRIYEAKPTGFKGTSREYLLDEYITKTSKKHTLTAGSIFMTSDGYFIESRASSEKKRDVLFFKPEEDPKNWRAESPWWNEQFGGFGNLSYEINDGVVTIKLTK